MSKQIDSELLGQLSDGEMRSAVKSLLMFISSMFAFLALYNTGASSAEIGVLFQASVFFGSIAASTLAQRPEPRRPGLILMSPPDYYDAWLEKRHGLTDYFTNLSALAMLMAASLTIFEETSIDTEYWSSFARMLTSAMIGLTVSQILARERVELLVATQNERSS